MSEKQNKNDSSRIKNNELFVSSPNDDEDVENVSENIDSFEFILPFDDEDTNDNDDLHITENDSDIAIMDIPDHKDMLHLGESVSSVKAVKPAKKGKPVKSKMLSEAVKTKKVRKSLPVKEKKPIKTGMFIFTISAKLTLICTVVAVLIAAVYTVTAPLIAKNESAKKEAALAEIFPEMSAYDVIPCDDPDINELYLVRNADSVIGYCTSVSPKGYGGEISLMIGINTDRSIADIKVLSHAETPGYGADALTGEYMSTSGYIGFNGDNAVLGADVDTYSGATRTSRALNNGVNSALAVYDEYILPYIGEIEPATELTPEEIEAAAVEKAYGWVTEDHRAIKSATSEHDFDEIYGIKVTDPIAGEIDGGFAAVVTIEGKSGNAKLIVTTWFKTINSIELIASESEEFAELADNHELMGEIKSHINSGITPEGETFSQEGYAVYEKALEVLGFYPTYLELITASEEGGNINE